MGTDDTTYCTQAKFGVSYVLRGGWEGKAILKAYQWADEGRQLCIGSNSTSKKAGSNRVVISLAPSESEPWRGDQTVALTHREARALQRFLNDSLG